MAFADEFSQRLADGGVPLDASAVPAQEDLQQGLAKLRGWVDSLDDTTRSAVDEITGDFPTNAGLADADVGIAPELGSLLSAVDALQASIPVSRLLEQCESALAAVQTGGGA